MYQVKQSKKKFQAECLAQEDGTDMMSLRDSNQQTSCTAQQPNREETSTTPCRKHEISKSNRTFVLFYRSSQIFQTSRCHLKILGACKVTVSKFHSEDPQIFGTNLQNLITATTDTHGLFSPVALHT
jgi:hypothetical protein